MTTPDFRALCADLLKLAEESDDYLLRVPEVVRLVDRARAALAQPEGEGPTEPNAKAVRSGNFLDPGIWEIKP